jgi:hypothetical protein
MIGKKSVLALKQGSCSVRRRLPEEPLHHTQKLPFREALPPPATISFSQRQED